MLPRILEKNQRRFEIKNIIKPVYLDRCHRTAFVWSSLPDTLALAADEKYFSLAAANPNIAGIVAPASAVDSAQASEKALVISPNAAELFYFLHNQGLHREYGLFTPPSESRIAASARVAPSAVIGQKVVLGEEVVVEEGCILGDGTIVGRGTVLMPQVVLGMPSSFGKRVGGRKVLVEHYGGVRIGENCVLHTGAVIDRSVNVGEYTVVEDEVHIGKQSSVAHDCIIGKGSDLAVKVSVCGRVRIGANCWIGAGAVISNALTIGNHASVRIGSVVIRDVPPERDVSGNFAIDHQRNIERLQR